MLQFYSGNTLLQTFKTSDVTNFINQLANNGGYRGNPNPQFKGANSSENYAFLNFYADPSNPNVTFTKVVITNVGNTGFESDNHTIAATYGEITGELVPPEIGEPPPLPIDPEPGEPSVEIGPGGEVETPDVNIPPGAEVEIDDGGMIMVEGPTTVDPNGDLEITVGGPLCQDSGKLIDMGHVTLSGTLILSSFDNFHPSSGDHYTIIVALGGISGEFSHVVDTLNTAGLTRVDIYAPNGLVTAYLPPGHGALNLNSEVSIPLNSICDVEGVCVSGLDPDAEQLSAPFDIWFQLAQTQRFNLEARLDDVMAGSTGFVSNVPNVTPPEPKEVITGKEAKEVAPSPLQPSPTNRWGVWVTGYGDFVNIDGEGATNGYNYTTGGMTVGVDYRVTDYFLVGLMGGYAHTWTDLKPGDADVNTGWGGAYAGYFNRGFYVLGAAFGGGNTISTSRSTAVGDLANGSSDSEELSTFISGGYDFHCGQLTIGPAAALQYSWENLNGFTETGSIAALRVSGDSEDSLRTDLGFRAWYTCQIGQIGIRPFIRAAWDHEYKESSLPVNVTLVDIPGAPVTFLDRASATTVQ